MMWTELAFEPSRIRTDAGRRLIRKDDATSLVEQRLAICLVVPNSLGINLIRVLIHRDEQTAIQAAQMHSDLALRPVDRLRLLKTEVAQRLEILLAHGLHFERVRLGAFRQALNHAVEAQCEMPTVRRKARLHSRIRITLPDSAAHSAQILDDTRLFPFACFEQAQNAAIVLLVPCPAELIPKRATARVADLGAA